MSPVPGSPPDLAPADRGGWDVPRPPTAAGASHEIAAMPQLSIQSSGPHYNREHVILNPAGLVSARLFRVTDAQAEAVRALLAGEAQLEPAGDVAADAARWRYVSDKAWFIDSAAWVYGLSKSSLAPAPDPDEVIARIDAEMAAQPAQEAGHA